MTPPVVFGGAYYISLGFCFDAMQDPGLVRSDSELYRSFETRSADSTAEFPLPYTAIHLENAVADSLDPSYDSPTSIL